MAIAGKIDMRGVLLMALLAVACSDAAAEWIRIGSNESGAFYADPGTIIKTSHKVKMRTLYDYEAVAKVAGDAFVSVEAQEEYDCKEKLARTLHFTSFSKNSGKGRKFYTDPEPHNWEPAKSGSVRETLWKFACRRS